MSIFALDDDASHSKISPVLVVLLLLSLVLSYLSLIAISHTRPLFQVGFDPGQIQNAFPGILLSLIFTTIFVVARFSFGYFISFYMFMMVSGFFWINAFSQLDYNQTAAFLSTSAAFALFVLPLVAGRHLSFPNRLALSHAAFERMLICGVGAVATLAVYCAWGNFHLVGLDEMYRLRDTLNYPRVVRHLIGTVVGVIIPFLFTCFLMRRRWGWAAVVLALAALYYPVTLTKLSLFEPFWLLLLAGLSIWVSPKTAVVLSLLVPLVVALVAYVAGADVLFGTLSLRLFAIPPISLERYYAFFEDQPLTHFCQIAILKSIITCPYSGELGVVFADRYHLGNMNASLFATEGVASVGPMWMPVSVFVCGVLLSLGNIFSAGLPDRMVFLSASMVPVILLSVPFSTIWLSHGLALLFLLWWLTPRDYFDTAPVPAAGAEERPCAEAA